MGNVRRWYGEGEIPVEDLDKPVEEKEPPAEEPAGVENLHEGEVQEEDEETT